MTQHGGQSAVRNESKQGKPDRVYRLWVIGLYREHAGRDYPKCFGKSLYKLRALGVAPTPMSTRWKNVKGNKRKTEERGHAALYTKYMGLVQTRAANSEVSEKCSMIMCHRQGKGGCLKLAAR